LIELAREGKWSAGEDRAIGIGINSEIVMSCGRSDRRTR
jgi:hypothetical protein